MADFEKVHTGHKRWTAQWPAVRAHACTLANFGTGQSRAGLGAWPVPRSLRCGTVSNAFVLLSPV